MKELYHHGIKGQKWGVRKDKNTEKKNFDFKEQFSNVKEKYNQFQNYKTQHKISNTKKVVGGILLTAAGLTATDFLNRKDLLSNGKSALLAALITISGYKIASQGFKGDNMINE